MPEWELLTSQKEEIEIGYLALTLRVRKLSFALVSFVISSQQRPSAFIAFWVMNSRQWSVFLKHWAKQPFITCKLIKMINILIKIMLES